MHDWRSELFAAMVASGAKGIDTYQINQIDRHCRWWYTSHMNTNEGYLFYGSNPDAETNLCGTFHTAICDPTTLDDVPPRHSIETRVFVFWD